MYLSITYFSLGANERDYRHYMGLKMALLGGKGGLSENIWQPLLFKIDKYKI